MKKKVLCGIGVGTAVLAACAVGIKKVFDRKHKNDDLNDEEVMKITTSQDDDKSEDEDRGVSPIDSDENETDDQSDDDDEVKDLKADTINDGYKPIKY